MFIQDGPTPVTLHREHPRGQQEAGGGSAPRSSRSALERCCWLGWGGLLKDSPELLGEMGTDRRNSTWVLFSYLLHTLP